MKNSDFELLLESVRQMKAIRSGKMKPGRVFKFSSEDVKAIREKLKLSQTDFAEFFGVPVGTLRGWEQGRRVPDGPAVTLLKAIRQEPEIMLKVLSSVK